MEKALRYQDFMNVQAKIENVIILKRGKIFAAKSIEAGSWKLQI